jgi:hypothetical protein
MRGQKEQGSNGAKLKRAHEKMVLDQRAATDAARPLLN